MLMFEYSHQPLPIISCKILYYDSSRTLFRFVVYKQLKALSTLTEVGSCIWKVEGWNAEIFHPGRYAGGYVVALVAHKQYIDVPHFQGLFVTSSFGGGHYLLVRGNSIVFP